jgi:anhydro-N-acetylmuramic acid kinase
MAKNILRCCAGFNRSFPSGVSSGPKDELFIGVLSGTSVDAVDAVLVRFNREPELLATHTLPYPAELRAELLALATPGDNEIDRLGSADVRVGRHFAQAVNELLARHPAARAHVVAVGSHGQTVRHRPRAAAAFTLQIGDPNAIAADVRLPVVADFRRKDMALGGQGAPLVPAFHAAVFRSEREDRVVVNIGGIANLTVLPADAAAPVLGYDTGPGNTLLDAWCRRHTGQPMDFDGAFASRGQVNAELLARLLGDEFFRRPAPKSTGPEHFSLAWLDSHTAGISAPDVQATLVALTAQSIADGIRTSLGHTEVGVFVCGGGAKNPVLMQALAERLGAGRVGTTASLGVDPAWVEAMAFAWLARQHVRGLPGNCPAVTGASRPAVLGGLWRPE